ncbi:MAG: AAA-like domain-containing protein [Actinomycetota bacterium]|nr:AAA-like domain-containing protein [Actinomycetota bacterium]MDQ3954532.1 AAA-like domain-containing protein [Actinomycetota bacterium]
MTSFYVQGAVPLEATAYVERAFESEVLRVALARRSLLLLGPRQHGKTSALIRVKRLLREAGFDAALVDLQEIPPSRYEDFLRRVAYAIARDCAVDIDESHVRDPASFEDWLAEACPPGSAPIVLIIDEASAIVDDEQRNTFYGQIRALKNRAADASPGSLPARLICIFAGTFRWESLVETENSPFNVIDKIYSEDFSLDQALDLARAQRASDFSEVAKATYDFVGGQPYLLQRVLLSVAEAPAREDDVFERLIAAFRRGDDLHFQALVQKVESDARLIALVDKLVSDGHLSNEPADYDLKYLEVVGVTSLQEDNYVFRNDAYKNVFESNVRVRRNREPRLPM